jgi:hypothetical protein
MRAKAPANEGIVDPLRDGVIEMPAKMGFSLNDNR